eukprot:TRINITY_DN35257_c0_g1_i5.p1 TRINITY_DN35257_c0_g1~~TRINITY_DN35257_c0_g1_i5.p1  ORF type:complete len:212 (+),score=15.20 TRINITY_DN35257_c0_g1_i5:150-785(+)
MKKTNLLSFLVLLVSGVTSQPFCQDCTLLVGSLLNFIANPYIQASLEGVLESQVCLRIPGNAVQEDCDEFIKMFVPSMFQYLSQELSPDAVCGDVNLCDVTAFEEQTGYTDPAMVGGAYCEYCEMAVLAVKSYITNSTSKFETVLDYVCEFLPTGSQTCRTLVQDYLVSIVMQIEDKYLNPVQVCDQLKFCPVPSSEQIQIKVNERYFLEK